MLLFLNAKHSSLYEWDEPLGDCGNIASTTCQKLAKQLPWEEMGNEVLACAEKNIKNKFRVYWMNFSSQLVEPLKVPHFFRFASHWREFMIQFVKLISILISQRLRILFSISETVSTFSPIGPLFCTSFFVICYEVKQSWQSGGNAGLKIVRRT